MAKRAPAARALVHVLRPNKTKAPGPARRARKSVKKARRSVTAARKRGVTRTTIRGGIGLGKMPFRGGRAAGRVVGRAANRLPKKTRVRVVRPPLFIRGEKGRFAGSHSRSGS